MIRAFKYRLYPNQEQKVLLEKHFGCVRFIWNWALNKKMETYQTTKKNVLLLNNGKQKAYQQDVELALLIMRLHRHLH